MREKSAAKDKELKKNEKLLQQIEAVSSLLDLLFLSPLIVIDFVLDCICFRKRLVAIRKT